MPRPLLTGDDRERQMIPPREEAHRQHYTLPTSLSCDREWYGFNNFFIEVASFFIVDAVPHSTPPRRQVNNVRKLLSMQLCGGRTSESLETSCKAVF